MGLVRLNKRGKILRSLVSQRNETCTMVGIDAGTDCSPNQTWDFRSCDNSELMTKEPKVFWKPVWFNDRFRLCCLRATNNGEKGHRCCCACVNQHKTPEPRRVNGFYFALLPSLHGVTKKGEKGEKMGDDGENSASLHRQENLELGIRFL